MYNLQTRLLVATPGTGDVPLPFPGRYTIEATLGPLSAFGMADEPGRTVLVGPDQQFEIIFDPKNGRVLYRSVPPMKPLQVSYSPIESESVEVIGNVVRYTADAVNVSELQAALEVFLFALPPLLNLVHHDPPFVHNLKVFVGDRELLLHYKDFSSLFVATTQDDLSSEVKKSFGRIKLFEPDRIRLLKALQYFHVACRLRAAGTSDWEFAAEFVLNLAKTLDVLFAQSEDSNDDIRAELRSLGYDNTAIERDFLTIKFLRNAFDVGHPKLAAMPPDQLQMLYQFLVRAMGEFRKLLALVIEKIEKGEYTLRPPEHATLADTDDQRTWDRIIANIRSVMLPAQPPTPPSAPAPPA
jgi:hypothetical protein